MLTLCDKRRRPAAVRIQHMPLAALLMLPALGAPSSAQTWPAESGVAHGTRVGRQGAGIAIRTRAAQ